MSLTIRGSAPAPTTVASKSFDSTTDGMTGWYNATTSVSTTTKRTGAGALKVTASDAWQGVVDANMQTVVPGTNYNFTVYARAASAGASIKIVARWFDSSWTQLGYTWANPGITDTTTSWTPIAASMIAPPGATMLLFGLQIDDPSSTAVHYFDDYTLTSSAVTLTTTAAKGFETGTDNMTDTWQATVSSSTTYAHTGTHSLKVVPTDFWYVEDATGGITITPTSNYQLTGWQKHPSGGGATMYAAIDWYDGSGTWLRSDDIVQTENYTGDWVPFTTQQITPPAGATKAGIRLSGDGTGTWYIDDLTLTTVAPATTTQVWSYPNIHGDIQATADATGTKQGNSVTYDPYGNPLTTTPDNITGGIDNTWLGQHNRWNERNIGSRPLIQMGARAYDSMLGRFLEKDPIEGGCLSDYSYPEDPVNSFDLNGLEQCSQVLDKGPWAVFRIKAGNRVLVAKNGRRLRGFNLIWNPIDRYKGNIQSASLTVSVTNSDGRRTLGNQNVSGPHHSYGHSGFLGLHGVVYAGVGDTMHITGTIIWKNPIKIVRTLAADLVVGATSIDITCTV